jgi:hypothetical protein
MGQPNVFISYSHKDKLVAHRLVRELRPYGFQVWVDEAELLLGAMLSSSPRAHNEAADAVFVVGSVASATSHWVALEVRHAMDHGKRIIPVYVESVETAEMFEDYLGVDATPPAKSSSGP